MIDADTFERERLALFEDHGFSGESEWIADNRDRQTYAIVNTVDRNDPACPTILIHGGLSEAGEWFALGRHVAGGVVIADRPGCGLSYRVDYSGYDGTQYRRAAEEWLDGLIEGLGAQRLARCCGQCSIGAAGGTR